MIIKDNSKTLSQDHIFPIALGWMLTATVVAIATWAGLYLQHRVL
jgi:hypothetical protein